MESLILNCAEVQWLGHCQICLSFLWGQEENLSFTTKDKTNTILQTAAMHSLSHKPDSDGGNGTKTSHHLWSSEKPCDLRI